MKKPDLEFRPATAADIAAYSELDVNPTMKAWVADRDSEILGIGGFALSGGRWYAFCDLKEGLRRHKTFIVRSAKTIMDEARRQGIQFIYAEVDKDEPCAIIWMESLGFHLDPRSGYLYRWRNGVR